MGVFLHDIGKIEELSSDHGFAYTDAGQLLGHVVLAISMLDAKLSQAEELAGEPIPAGNCPTAEAHDRQPSRRIRIRLRQNCR